MRIQVLVFCVPMPCRDVEDTKVSEVLAALIFRVKMDELSQPRRP